MTARVAWIGVAVAALVAAVLAFRVGMAWRVARPVQDLLVLAARGDARIAPAQWQDAEAAAADAVDWYGSAELLELHGRVLTLGADAFEPRTRREWLLRAIERLRDVTERRPHWPYGWANLATAKAALGAVDDEFATAVVAARRFGPREARIARQLASLRLIVGWRVSPATREVLDAAFDDALAERGDRWVDRADRAGEGAWACARPALGASARGRCIQLDWLKRDPPNR